MKKGKILSVVLGLAVIAPVLAFAQTDINSAKELAPIKAIQNIRKDAVEKAKNVREELKQDVKDIRERTKDKAENIREQVKETRTETKEKFDAVRGEVKSAIEAKRLMPEQLKAFQDKREEVKNEFEMKREEFKKDFESKREEMKKEIETKREEFKKRLETVKDERKKQVAEKLFDGINSLNTKAMDNFKKSVDQIEAVLNRILSRSQKAAANGANVDAVNVASDLAKKAIEDARAAIQFQAGKTYSVVSSSTPASDENTLRTDLTGMRNQLRQDLESVKTKIKTARDAVHNAATTLAQIPKVDELEVTQ
ncbi:MAG: hypothetical protein AAB399_00610 [Patescibacteria group bacterium]